MKLDSLVKLDSLDLLLVPFPEPGPAMPTLPLWCELHDAALLPSHAEEDSLSDFNTHSILEVSTPITLVVAWIFASWAQ